MRGKKKRIEKRDLLYIEFSGEDVIEVTPVPIPNTEVKLNVADNSWGMPPVKIGVRQIFYVYLQPKGCFFVFRRTPQFYWGIFICSKFFAFIQNFVIDILNIS